MLEIESEAQDLVQFYRTIRSRTAAEALQPAAAALGRALGSLERARSAGAFGNDDAWAIARQELSAARRLIESVATVHPESDRAENGRPS
jgi:hypothetical protein